MVSLKAVPSNFPSGSGVTQRFYVTGFLSLRHQDPIIASSTQGAHVMWHSAGRHQREAPGETVTRKCHPGRQTLSAPKPSFCFFPLLLN